MDRDLLSVNGVRLGLDAVNRADAIGQAGELLVALGAVTSAYADAMQEREAVLSSYVGEGFALPHGTDASRAHVKRAAVVFLQFPEGVDWEGERVRACIGIAARSDEHIDVMARLAQVLSDPDKAERLRSTARSEEVLELLTPERSIRES
ncbi:MAG: PTS sugar transporter subunit IIA [bacterium]